MRNGQNHNQQHHHQLQHIGTFLPMLCSKPSMIKNVHIPNPFSKDHSSSRRIEDPSLSPKVGCMGQVKKKNQNHNNHKLGIVFPTSNTTSYSSKASTNYPSTELGHGISSNFSYSKLLRLFSSKTLLATPSVLSSASTKRTKTTTTTISCRNDHHQRRVRSRSCEDNGAVIGFGSPINVADLDPPLPVVIKKVTTTCGGGDQVVLADGDNSKNSSLWNRRSGGASLKGLEIKQVHVQIQSTTSSV